MVKINLGKITFAYKGEYSPISKYESLDIVRFQNSSFICKKVSQRNNPKNSEYWDLFIAGIPYLQEKNSLLFMNNQPEALKIGSENQFLSVKNNLPQWKNHNNREAKVSKLQKGAIYGCGAIVGYIMDDGTVRVCGNSANVYASGEVMNRDRATPVGIAPQSELYNNKVKEIYACHYSFFLLTENGEVFAWGKNSTGTHGVEDTSSRNIPVRIDYFIEKNIRINEIVVGSYIRWAGEQTVYFITDNGEIYSCGYNGQGQLGIGSTSQKTTPQKVGDFIGVKQVAISGSYASSIYLIDSNNELWSCGYNNYGQLGQGSTSTKTTFKKVPNITDVKKVVASSGDSHSSGNNPGGYVFILKNDGTALSCGYNGQGQLCLGNNTNQSLFNPIVGNIGNIKDIQIGGGFYGTTAIIDDNKELFMCGENFYGELGLGDTSNKNYPTKPIANFQGKVKKVVVGGHYHFNFTLVLDNDGILWGAGYGNHGQLSQGYNHPTINNIFKKFITPFPNIKVVDMITTGYDDDSSVFVLLEDGRVFACGRDDPSWKVLGVSPYYTNSKTLMKEVRF